MDDLEWSPPRSGLERAAEIESISTIPWFVVVSLFLCLNLKSISFLSCLKVISFTQVLIRVERTTEAAPTTVSDMDLSTTVRVTRVFNWKAIFTAAQVNINNN